MDDILMRFMKQQYVESFFAQCYTFLRVDLFRTEVSDFDIFC